MFVASIDAPFVSYFDNGLCALAAVSSLRAA